MDEETRVTQVHARVPLVADGVPEDACLVLIYPPGADLGKRFELVGPDVTIGRGQDCDILLDRDAVSRRHARIGRTEEGWRVRDLDSTNGSYVNDVPIKDYTLHDGDRLRIGNAIFKFLAGGNVESAYHEEIYRMTIIDGLTSAYNKRYFVEHVERELARIARSRRPLSLVMFDIDHFKNINDTHGHLTGDHVLKELAQRVRRRVRKDEVFARYGGEEFAVVLPETSRENALQYAEKLRSIVEVDPFLFDDESIPVTISLGVSSTTDEIPILTFIKAADDYLYKAKRAGRNQVMG